MSPSITDDLNDQANSLQFTLVDLSGQGLPELEDEVVITLADDSKIFGGTIISTNLKKKEMGTVAATVQCIDYTRLLDSNLVATSYQNKTDQFIIRDIVSNYCAGTGITTANVGLGVTIDQITFNYLQPSQCFRKIAELTGRNWYIDYDKDVHYFASTENAAPFDINSSNAEYFDLNISKDASQIKNRVYVRGGTYLSDTFTFEEKGDGKKRSFTLPDKPHDITFAINGVSKSVGIKNVNLTGFDAYLNFQEKYVELDASITTPTDSDTLTFTYQYDIPILVAVEDFDSIETYGQKEFAIFDKTIRTTQAGRDRAQAELTDYANNVIEGNFKTHTTGFVSGQFLNINLPEYGVNADYLVQRVSATSMGGGMYEYSVDIVSAKTVGIIKFLIELLEANKNLVELNDDEVVDELFSATDSLNSDSLTDALTIDSQGAYFTWATDSLEITQTRLRWDLGQWG
ncbi:MAG TPA: hypothetical protein VD999_05815 [Vitreimonas sp.]|nr:hypothetical protein [Vitreimonas sp.]